MQENIKAGIKAAMIAKDMDRLNILRLISAAFTNDVVSQGRTPTDPLSDDDAVRVLKKLSKQRKDSIEQFVAGGREDLADAEKAELAIIEGLLPAQMSTEDIEKFVSEKIADAKANSPTDLENKGKFTGQVMKMIGTNADGAVVKEVIEKLLA